MLDEEDDRALPWKRKNGVDLLAHAIEAISTGHRDNRSRMRCQNDFYIIILLFY